MTKRQSATGGNQDTLVLSRDRDAHASIAGYVYQVDLTVQRWLELGPGEFLELERGEDIDRVLREIASDGPNRLERVMEQAKRLRRSVTLNSTGVREALAGFYEHFIANPGLILRFRFTTTAPTTSEKPNPFANRVPGIEVWTHLASASRVGRDVRHELSTLRRLLLEARRPPGFAKATWSRWCDFLQTATDESALSFVRLVEFATGSKGDATLRSEIELSLVASGRAADPETAKRLYSTLFASVFLRLTSGGIKRITKQDLDQELAGVGLGASNRAFEARIEEFRQLFDVRLSAVEEGLGNVKSSVASLETATMRVESRVETLTNNLAPRGLRAGDSVWFQTTDNYFGDELRDDATFTHARQLRGRREQLTQIVSSIGEQLRADGGVVSLSGVGGVGKSRLLLAVARKFEAGPDASEPVTVRWLRDDSSVNAAGAVDELPNGPALIICDDSHRRSDVQSIVQIVQSRAAATTVLLGTRPRGRDAVRVAASLSGIDRKRVLDLGEIADLERDDLVALVRDELDVADRYLAPRIVEISRGSTVVATVAARLLYTRRLHPQTLALDEEARDAIFAGFEDEILRTVGSDDVSFARRVLQVVALAAPFPVKKREILERTSALLKSEPSRLIQTIGVLQDAGVLREQRTGLRIVPDVLADYIAYKSLVAFGRATNYEERVAEALGDDTLANIVRNVAELDWQIDAQSASSAVESSKSAGPDVFSAVWDRVAGRVKRGSNALRRDLLGRLKPVAAFQPGEILRIISWVLDNPSPAEDSEFGFPVNATTVAEAVAPLLSITALHEKHFDEAIDLLWQLTKKDKRESNSYPDHPIRQIAAVVSYHSWSDSWIQTRAVEALRRWTRTTGWSLGPHSPLVVTDRIFVGAIVQDSMDWKTRTVTMTRRAVNIGPTLGPRLAAIDTLRDLSLGTDTRGRVLAVEALLKALAPPSSEYGHVVTDAEEDKFRPQYEYAFAAIARIFDESKDSYVRLELGDGLVGVWRQTRLQWKRERAQELVAAADIEASERTARVWAQRFRRLAFGFREKMIDRSGEQAVADAETHQELIRILERYGDDPGEWLTQYIAAELARIQDAGVAPRPENLLMKLSDKRSDMAVQLAAWVICADEGEPERKPTRWLAHLLHAIRVAQPDAYGAFVRACVTSATAEIRSAAARALDGRSSSEPWTEPELAAMLELVRDIEPPVRVTAMEAVARRPGPEQLGFLRVVEIGGVLEVAEAVASCWAYRDAKLHPAILAEDARRLLAMLLEVPDLGSHADDIDQMLAALVLAAPLDVVDFLFARAKREAEYWYKRSAESGEHYDALPFQGLPHLWGALQKTTVYQSVVERLLVGEAEAELNRRERAAAGQAAWFRDETQFIRHVVRWDDTIESLIREWMRKGDCVRVGALNQLLSDQPPAFVVDRRPFISDLVEWAARCSANVSSSIEQALLSPMEVPVARQVGQPHPIYDKLRADATTIVKELRAEQPARLAASAFYVRVAADAEDRIKRDSARDSLKEERLAEEVDDDDILLEDE